MNDDINRKLWSMAVDSPELQQAIIRSMSTGSGSGGYKIPTRQYCETTGEVEDIHFNLLDMEDPAQKEELIKAIQKVDRMTVGQLAKILSYTSTALRVKEAEGMKLSEPERTLRDIDITYLALAAVLSSPKVIGRTTPIKKESET